jgi:ATPase subunit of ABC transporter with duplicated ATPase domains
MGADVNLLILDEPTNHLDLPSREWIEDALREYKGTLLFVSHDRYFTDEFATRIWELEDGKFTDYDCAYAQYRAIKRPRPKPAPEARPDRSGRERPGKQTPRNQRRLTERLEREIAELEAELARLSAAREEAATDFQKLMELDAAERGLNARLEEKIELWGELAEG